MLSVIIPALNEAACLRATLLPQLLAQHDIDLDIIVAPADSTDDTASLAEVMPVRMASGPRGRGRQMNAGASAARGDHLLFLHADSQLLSPALLRDALAAMRGRPRAAGHFELRFVGGEGRFAYQFHASKTRLNRPETINGDQGILISRAFFAELGGFSERLSFLEDQLFAARVFEHGTWILLPGQLATSVRRFEQEGLFRRMAASAIIMAMHHNRFEEFFEEIPDLYQPHADCRRFDFLAFSDAVEELLRRHGAERTREIRRAAGAYVRQNAWQLAHLADVLIWRRADGPSLQLYERHLARRLDCRLADRTATLMMMAWYRLTRGWFRAHSLRELALANRHPEHPTLSTRRSVPTIDEAQRLVMAARSR